MVIRDIRNLTDLDILTLAASRGLEYSDKSIFLCGVNCAFEYASVSALPKPFNCLAGSIDFVCGFHHGLTLKKGV